MCRTILLAFALLALIAFAPASAAPAPAAPGGYPPSLDLLAPVTTATPVCAAAVPAAAPAQAPQPTFMTSATVYHGYCRCTCSKIPDCNTNADCSNGRCLGGISCC